MHYRPVCSFYYFVVLLVMIFQVSSKRLLPPSDPCYQKNFDCGHGKPGTLPNPVPKCGTPQYVVISQHNPPSGSIFANEPSVTLFTNKFLETVDSTDILSKVFDLSATTAKQYATYLKLYSEEFLSEIGVENAVALAEWATRAIFMKFNVLTLPVVLRVFANVVANFLFVDGYLRIENAEDLGLAFAQAIIDSAEANMKEDPTSKFQAIVEGYVNYMSSLDMLSKEKAALQMYYIGNEWFVAAVNYKLW